MSHTAALSRLYHGMPSPVRVAGRALLGARTAIARLRNERARPSWHRPPSHPVAAPALPVRQVLQAADIRFRRLLTPEDIACVLPLRREINLPLAGDPGFAALEKKEMSAALSAPSSGVDKSSARSASFPWAAAWLRARRSSPGPACRRTCCPTAGK